MQLTIHTRPSADCASTHTHLAPGDREPRVVPGLLTIPRSTRSPLPPGPGDLLSTCSARLHVSGFLDYRSLHSLLRTSVRNAGLLEQQAPAGQALLKRWEALQFHGARAARHELAALVQGEGARQHLDEASVVRSACLQRVQGVADLVFLASGSSAGLAALAHGWIGTPVDWWSLAHWQAVSSPMLEIAALSLCVSLSLSWALAPAHRSMAAHDRTNRARWESERMAAAELRSARGALAALQAAEAAAGRPRMASAPTGFNA